MCVLEFMCFSFKASFKAQGRATFKAKAKAKEMGNSGISSRCSYLNCMCFSFVFQMHVCVYLCFNCEVLGRKTCQLKNRKVEGQREGRRTEKEDRRKEKEEEGKEEQNKRAAESAEDKEKRRQQRLQKQAA